MGYPEISVSKESTPTTYGGAEMTKHQRYKKGINVAEIDPTNKPDIATETRYRSGTLLEFMQNNSNYIKHVTPAMGQNVEVGYPTTLDDEAVNVQLFEDTAQEINNKVISGETNTFPDFIAERLQLTNETGVEPTATTLITPLYRKDQDANNQQVFISKRENGSVVKVRVC